MLVLLLILQAVAGGAHLGAVLATLTAWQWISLAHAGIKAPHDISRIVAFSREMDRRFPCDRRCQKMIAERRFEMNGGPIGWGRSPYKYM